MSEPVTLSRLLRALGEPIIDVPAAPRGLEVRVSDVVIVDPADLHEPVAPAPGQEPPPGPEHDGPTVDIQPGDLVLLIGARGDRAADLLAPLARAGATAVAVKATATERDQLRQAAQNAQLAVLAVRPQVRWEQLDALCRGVVGDGDGADTSADLAEAHSDLFSLAQTIAALTGGLVSIEDSASRVLAYSGAGEEVDELRRLSVLGRQGPERYLALLREWGVFQRLRSSDDVVLVDEHPELGLRRRLAVRVHAGGHTLGTVWVQEGEHPFTARAHQALRGAARVVALHLLRQRTEASAGHRLRDDVLAGLVEGRVQPEVAGGLIELADTRSVAVAALELHPVPGATGGIEDRSVRELQLTQLTNLVRMHAAAYRRSDLVTRVGSRIYVVLEERHPPRQSGPEAAVEWARTVAAEARTLLGIAVRGAVGPTVPSIHAVAESRSQADRVLAVVAERGDAEVATIADVRAQLLVGTVLGQLQADPGTRDPRVSALVEHDARHGSQLARSTLVYLRAFGDVRRAAGELHVHPNTLRYRLRQATAVSGLDLDDADQRLFAQLQLRLELG
ncbi:helix-turn-helix domain-containing protein [Lipingzhangella sp. LS1_29]|uniref:Helix-turn-helix domain-containing protein n=1 Tax=Lipingzhangella rawalii TaxID=2055835 RepID=A0ABU2HA68_9ACTN|nr:helix-turn-helix domain-containing protein [Lipingzhangella rawalii]MDS1272163.1 helix-turn-helix domain-containing protein [Lipingzhangella rawalii]